MRTWPRWLKITLGICLMVALATPAFAGEENEDEKTTSAVVVVKKSVDGGTTKTVRVVRMKDGRWVAEGEDAEGEPNPDYVPVQIVPGKGHEVPMRVLFRDGKVVPLDFGKSIQRGVKPKMWPGFVAAPGKGKKGACAGNPCGPLHTVLRYMIEKHAGKKVDGCPMDAWFSGGSVPMQGLRDAFVEDGWTAAKLKAWMSGRKPQPPQTAMMFGGVGEAHRAPAPMHPGMHPGMRQGMHHGMNPHMGMSPMWRAPVQARTIVMWHDGKQWRRQELPSQGGMQQAPWMYGMPFGGHPHMFGPGMSGAGGYGRMLPLQGAWPSHPGMGNGKMRGRCSDRACNCPDCPSQARKPMARGLGLPSDMPKAARHALILALGGEIAEEAAKDEGDEAAALMVRLLPSILLEEAATGSKCDDCPNKGSCGGCDDKSDCGSSCKGKGKKANPDCDCPCNGACGGDCENCPMKKKQAEEKECCGSCGGAAKAAK